ncbi:ACT domain-containing protein, partial [Gordonia sp. 852002-10350_SCH5691597]|uniref:ACT domain-containing protein n=1 Tax=Gordonia sp. 852002-10350_SCH5691597 TaxID=1834085 RepID=UPI000B011FAC
MEQSTPVLITVTGPDKPGVTSVLMGALAAQQVSLLDDVLNFFGVGVDRDHHAEGQAVV